mmetsp:Transcript_12015/g.14947  ORF Transcript_12015/g.14947 Transcript_12015/m.14947 type:complete len:106 (+) Transcript_12015:204-521(+)|eukprot:CAMPEP_0204827832 /NCGR_PEP_ID=MMETSP1346-20131115/5339_1 /ASSEMBLY_ACC=CAM_ASM_000771 /TAXON_ID=215587 /ORGANISM="Aplanochytrium stocchinoi, Strain GSBS06" /LENGTH=105 /DNA_ID=CAMNT_0051956451 /DNA_START=134 /DNA_END=451 /DNA_ORIENTATION=+
MVQKLVGHVVSTKMCKSIAVKVTREYLHPLFMKQVRKSKKFIAHDELETCNLGDKVEIIQSKPHSKRKRFELNRIIRRNPFDEKGNLVNNDGKIVDPEGNVIDTN